ncbi:hypothetical protein QO001_000852 [Methylobacterium brachiatum]|jgi:hypothetical protein|uniref:Uncharacterized protein n=1 Tax=Methylobacterium brachiatum TaxID=269660 RepID=A0AAJ1TNF8_9HYPH|nr:hypothetical protein [Methylobacterium brachiatum]MCB4803507.1 hypothetical protein [Methylobacterium brachiatum]MDQ0541944.1 hypothetical protein [Methylobacterium brachiatum]
MSACCDGPFRVRVLRPAEPGIVRVVVPGPMGGDGPPGASAQGNRSETAIQAAVALGGHKVVRGTPEGAVYASAAILSDLGTVIGVTTGAAAADADVAVVSSGAIDEPSWAWLPGPVWLGLDGDLTQTPPAGAFV